MTSFANDPPSGPEGRETDALVARGRKERVLVFIVSFLGLLIVAGLVAVIVRVIYLASPPATQRATAEPAAAASVAAHRLDLPVGAVVKSVSLDGDRVAVHYEAPGGTGIAILDLASGVVLRRIEVVPSGAVR